MLGIGVDICEVNRFEKLKQNKAFLKKIFTDNEIEYCEKRRNNAQCFAVRFAAKEAFVKAIGTGFRKGAHYKEIEVINNELGNPFLKITGLTNETLNRMNGSTIHLSLSHEKTSAIAFVIIEKES
ncbi:MAG: holo-ACP synthase [Spirochaetes bacterium]|nr:holo-ACP synthase [Spirochaetota bacterium]